MPSPPHLDPHVSNSACDEIPAQFAANSSVSCWSSAWPLIDSGPVFIFRIINAKGSRTTNVLVGTWRPVNLAAMLCAVPARRRQASQQKCRSAVRFPIRSRRWRRLEEVKAIVEKRLVCLRLDDRHDDAGMYGHFGDRTCGQLRSLVRGTSMRVCDRSLDMLGYM